MGFSLHFLADFFLMANSFTEMKLANLVTQSPPWAVEKPEIYADDARIELWIRFPQGAFQLIALGGKTWKNLLQQIPPGFEKYLPLLSWQQVRAPDPSGRQVDYQSIPFGNPMEKETNRLSYFGEALFQMPLQVKTLRVFQRDTKGAFFVSEEITEFIIP
ncbi:MAG: hypothetical protein ACD_39C01491G0004 [uncultured bacterium]|nr:MAG: hypothetical protein ACD_39C01491G0004 [uncultured bacterium]